MSMTLKLQKNPRYKNINASMLINLGHNKTTNTWLQSITNYLTKKLSEFEGLVLPKIYQDNTNVYYTYPIILKEEKNYNRRWR